jgi:ABC-type branched-subunit amino acid transport system substrate-binding protein
MSAEDTIYAALSGDAGVLALTAGRISPDKAPQDEPLPAIVYVRTDTEYIRTIHSSVAVGTIVTLEVIAFAQSRPDAEAVGDAVDAALGAAGITPIARRPEYNPETDEYASVTTCVI